MNCEIMKSPFSYLGVKVGGNHKRCAFWDGMLIKLRSRLSAWKGKSLSLAGRVCLIKSVLTSLPLFYVFLFCMPTTMVREVKRIQKNFLWDWGSKNRKIAWVAWDKICQPRDKGGLGVIDIGKFNLALLGKWIWRLKSKERSLWEDILVSKYGGWRDLRSQGQKSKDSVWRRDLRKVWNLEEWGNDFEDRGQWEVGDGKEIRFWEDKWLDNDTLLHKFPRLFSVSLDTGRNLSQVGVWNNNVWSWKLRWRRILFVWESNLVDILMQLLDNKRLTREGGFKPDKWLWRDGSTDFSVKTAYNILLGEESTVGEELFAEFWNLKTLPSVQFTAWRVLRNVIPTKDNLLRRGLLLISDRCPLCGEEEESVRHLFFECRISWRIWGMCLRWLGYSSVLHRDGQMHFRMFKPLDLKEAIIRCWGAFG